MLVAIGIIGWYANKIDDRVTTAERDKVDRAVFMELKSDIKSQFDSLHQDLDSQDRDSSKLAVQVAVVIERMTRLEIAIEKVLSKEGR
jgi:hypothetical protein